MRAAPDSSTPHSANEDPELDQQGGDIESAPDMSTALPAESELERHVEILCLGGKGPLRDRRKCRAAESTGYGSLARYRAGTEARRNTVLSTGRVSQEVIVLQN